MPTGTRALGRAPARPARRVSQDTSRGPVQGPGARPSAPSREPQSPRSGADVGGEYLIAAAIPRGPRMARTVEQAGAVCRTSAQERREISCSCRNRDRSVVGASCRGCPEREALGNRRKLAEWTGRGSSWRRAEKSKPGHSALHRLAESEPLPYRAPRSGGEWSRSWSVLWGGWCWGGGGEVARARLPLAAVDGPARVAIEQRRSAREHLPLSGMRAQRAASLSYSRHGWRVRIGPRALLSEQLSLHNLNSAARAEVRTGTGFFPPFSWGAFLKKQTIWRSPLRTQRKGGRLYPFSMALFRRLHQAIGPDRSV